MEVSVENTHSRRIDAPASAVGALIDGLAGPGDRLWPTPAWWPLLLDRPLGVGADGGHASIRYRVDEYEPGRRVRFAFGPGSGLAGFHEFSVTPDGPDACMLAHDMGGRTEGTAIVLWPLAIRWLHDALIEDLLDNAERAATGSVRRPAKRSPWVRLLRAVMSERPRAVETPRDAVLARGAFDRVDYADSFRIRLRPGMPTDPYEWARVIFFHRPFGLLDRSGDEALIGESLRDMDFRVSVLVEEGRLTMSTVVRFRNGLGPKRFALIKPFHRVFVRFMLRSAVHRVGSARAVSVRS
ncbi:DUF2867 domain-containing protein [Glycomyces sp. NEAU-7082]|uniref:DUF2867 domain-containing protein n=1 Tax=Glycomyces albidus TaxID=2656774 RepID=A0A6L5G7F9_9ACTN|nr:DUF2867 domain-containing protein [Glycomyces albidus]